MSAPSKVTAAAPVRSATAYSVSIPKKDEGKTAVDWTTRLDGTAPSRSRSVSHFGSAAEPQKPFVPPLPLEKAVAALCASVSTTERSASSSVSSQSRTPIDTPPTPIKKEQIDKELCAKLFKGIIEEIEKSCKQLMAGGKDDALAKAKIALFTKIYDDLNQSQIALMQIADLQPHIEKMLSAFGPELSLEFMRFAIDTDMPKQSPEDILRRKEVTTRLYQVFLSHHFEIQLRGRVILPIVTKAQEPNCQFGKLKTLYQEKTKEQPKEFGTIESEASNYCEKMLMTVCTVIKENKDPVLPIIHEWLFQAARKLFQTKPPKSPKDTEALTAEVAAKRFLSSAIFLRIISPLLTDNVAEFKSMAAKSVNDPTMQAERMRVADNITLVSKALQLIANGRLTTQEAHIKFATKLAKQHADLTLNLSELLRGVENIAVDEVVNNTIRPKWWKAKRQLIEQLKVAIKKRLTAAQGATFDQALAQASK